jgi:hypothetical protein
MFWFGASLSLTSPTWTDQDPPGTNNQFRTHRGTITMVLKSVPIEAPCKHWKSTQCGRSWRHVPETAARYAALSVTRKSVVQTATGVEMWQALCIFNIATCPNIVSTFSGHSVSGLFLWSLERIHRDVPQHRLNVLSPWTFPLFFARGDMFMIFARDFSFGNQRQQAGSIYICAASVRSCYTHHNICISASCWSDTYIEYHLPIMSLAHLGS